MNLRRALVGLIVAVGSLAAPLAVAAEEPQSRQVADEMSSAETSSSNCAGCLNGGPRNGFVKPE